MNIYFSENIRRLRKEHNLTQEALANFLGVSFQTVSKWERGESYPDIAMLPEIASFFKVSVDNLLGVNKAENEKEIQDMLTQFNNFVNDMEKKSELLKEMIKKFPNDFRIQVKQLGMLMCEEKEDGEYEQGRYEKEYIIELLEKSLAMLEFIYDDGNYGKMWRTIAYDYGHLGHLSFETGNEKKALEYLRKSAELAKRFDKMERITPMKSKLFNGRSFDKETLGSTYIASTRMMQLFTEKYPLIDEFKSKQEFQDIIAYLKA